MNNKVSRLSLSLLSHRKEERHWSDLSLLRQTSERGSEALLISEGLSDSIRGGIL